VEVAYYSEVGKVEDRRVGVLVDRDDRARPLHSHLVLDCAGDAAGDVELGRDGLARLADLRRVRIPAGVDDGPRRRDRAAERLCKVFAQLEVLRFEQAATACDDHFGVLDRRTGRFLVCLLDHARSAREVGKLRFEPFDLCAAAALLRVEGA
jgi:hypothetical protein